MIREILTRAKTELQQANIETAALDARLLLQHCLNISHEDLILNPDRMLSAHEEKDYFDVIARRMTGEPVSRIIGAREFWGLNFKLSPATLDPRADSETLIETALKYFPDKTQGLSILDLGTGSGCLLISLLHEYKNARGIGIDQSHGALEAAQNNAALNDVAPRAEWLAGDWWQGWDSTRTFDIIISNPPYIAESDRATLAREVLNHDPHAALFAGSDGLDCYRVIFAGLGSRLADHGFALIEMGFGQAEVLQLLATANGLKVKAVIPDLYGIMRCLILIK